MPVKIPKRKQINITVTHDLHKEVKMNASIRNISMNHWLICAIYQYMRKPLDEWK